MITALTLAPLVAAILILAMPAQRARVMAMAGALVSFALTAWLLLQFDGKLTEIKVSWIEDLGIDYHVGLDGTNALVLFLAALLARLSSLPATVLRGEVLPEGVPAAGLLILRDGEPGEPEVTLSPLAYHYQHRAEIEAVVQGADRDVAFDTLTASICTAIAADRTLGGLCDWVEAEAPRPVDLPVEGAASLKAAVIPVVLHYWTADPLG